MKTSGELNVGVYSGEDNHLVGTRTVPLDELTPKVLRAEVEELRAKQAAAFFVEEFWSQSTNPPKHSKRW